LKIDFLGLFDDLFCSIAVSLRWYLVSLPTPDLLTLVTEPPALAALDPPLEPAAAVDVAAVFAALVLVLGTLKVPYPE
jgi:hypothetical protein